jgi:amino acid adenylation domain-containing protein
VRSLLSSSDLINNIGRPFDNTSVLVLDPANNVILPRGAVGELCFGGYQVFRGYLNRPDLTAAKIIDHPVYGRIYRSGDMGTLLADDSILFAGRADDQVKVRGQRVELGEISSTILDQECARDCATLLLQSSSSPGLLVTFWIPVTATEPSFQPLNVQSFRPDILGVFAALIQRLPSYMIPSHLVPISLIPMTTQGKIDKRLLQESFDSLTDEDKASATCGHDALSSDVTALTTWEFQIAQILAELLGISTKGVGRNSSFFSFGLDSVSAISFSNQLRKANLGDFAISEILKNSSIAQLATMKDRHGTNYMQSKNSTMCVEKAITPSEVSRIRKIFQDQDALIAKIQPCTPLQEIMLSSDQSTSKSSYTNMTVFSVNGDLLRLQDCWALMVRRHEILRTSFVATNDPSHAFVQVVLEDASVQWNETTWSSATRGQANNIISSLRQANKPPVWLAVARSGSLPKLLFCCHHAMYDGIAMQTLLSEVQEAYHHQKLLSPISHEVYLQQMLAQDHAGADRFWTAAFRNFESTAFPNITGKIHKEPRTSASCHRRIQRPLSKIREACKRTSVTLLSVIHATWAKLLHYYTGESDVCFGTVVSGRGIPGHDLERLIAPCFNTLPIRINIDPRVDNLTLVRRAHAFNVDLFPYQLTPLRRIQNVVLKDGGRLFDTLVILQQPSKPLDSAIWVLQEDSGEMDLPLVCEFSQDEVDDRLHMTIHYHSTIISKIEAATIAETLEQSLVRILNQPHALTSDTIGIPPHLRSESHSDTENLEHEKQCLHSGFDRNVQLNPDRIALDFLHATGPRTIWSFQTLHDMAERVTHALLNHGIIDGDIVPVHIPKSPNFYASILGILKAGAAFAPVYPDLPETRKRLMFKDLNPKVILYAGDFTLPSVSSDIRLLDVGALEYSRGFKPDVIPLTSSSLAYCIFTSGSTGVPKAVSMEHCAPIQTIESSRSLIPWNNSSRLLQYAATTFDMCYYDCFLAWTFGFTLCAAEQNMMLNMLPEVIKTLGVDLLDLTPSVAASLARESVPNVKWLYCIGEAMTSDIVKEWEGACVNSYGPSEAAFCTTIYPVSKDAKPSIIGKPFPSTSFAIYPLVGEQVLPLLSIGELYIGGAQLAREYHGRSDLTAEKFVIKSGQRFYRSGDIVRMLSDGNFEFIGRKDDQVKIRGLRVELGEINVTLQDAHPAVITAVTQILRKDATAKDQLVAFLVAHQNNNDSDSDREQLRRHLRQVAKDRLPSYMVPQFLIFVDHIPRSLAGKVDKEALGKSFRHFADGSILPNGTSHDPGHSWSELESRIRHIFAHLSSSPLDDVSPTTTIYQLGLDSISAIQVAAALRKESHNVNATDVMKYLTCAELAAYIELNSVSKPPAPVPFDFAAFDGRHRSRVVASCSVSDDDVVAVRPCTPLQKGMLSQMLVNEGSNYVNYLSLCLNSGTSLDKLKEAWEKTMFTHQILRTGFVHVEDKDHPFIMIEYAPSAAILPWETVSSNDVVEASEAWLEKQQHRAVCELHRPLWSIRIVCEKKTMHLDLAIFHGLFDAHSLQLILRDVAAAYEGQNFELPMEISTVIGGILQRSTEYGEQAKEFWMQMGKRTTPCRFPNLAPLRYARERPAICTRRSKRPLKEIEDACRQSNTSLQAAGIASWLSLISEYTGESTATCGIVLSGRSFGDAQNASFPCINTVPFAHTVNICSTDMLDTVTSQIAEIQQYQHVPLNEIQRLMGHPNEALFDTIFAYQKLSVSQTGSFPWTVVDEKATTEYPLSIELEPNGDYLDYRLTFMPHTIPQKQASLMLEQLDYLVQVFVFSYERLDIFNPSLYSITPAKEPHLPSEALLLHHFVELATLKHPQRVALEFAASICRDNYSAKCWTYSELDAEGNKVANLLVSNGLQPGDLVGVCFEKCPEASFAMLGILKAGAAFVAIDPSAPAARQVFIIEDAGAAAVISLTNQSARFRESVKVPVLNLDELKTSSLPSTKPALCREISPQDRSYCLYTSGTTGTPKGCELTHENAVQALLSFQRLFSGHWDVHSRWLQFASFHFDVSVLEQYWSWSVGICVVSAPRDVILEDLANSISTLDITHIDLTPSLAQILHPDDVPSLCKGVFITGGESLKQEILDVWGPKGVIYNGYGPTEATIGCTMYPRVPANGKPSNIGRQFDNVGTFVLRPGSDLPVLRGGIGELCVSGKLVGKGYLGREDLTKKSFPYLERFKERVYRTGDLVRILHDKNFDFLGRVDDQVKLRGQRLEIGEINSVVRQSNNNISDVATLVLRHHRQQKEQLVAFVVQNDTKNNAKVSLASGSEIRSAKNACRDRLPPYMVPTHFIPLTSLPLNINNKVDVRKLKEIYEGLSAVDLQRLTSNFDEDDQPLSSLEVNIRAVVMEELNVGEDAIGRDTSFFELGMDSISVVGMARALKQAGVSPATASLVMNHSTLRQVVKAISGGSISMVDHASILAAQQVINATQHRHRHTVARSLSVDSSDIEAVLPCTPLQQGMIARSLESGNGLYFNTFQFELSNNVDNSKLRSAWQTVFESTQILRTVFTETEDGFVQTVLRNRMMPWASETTRLDESAKQCLSRLRNTWLQSNSNDFSRPLEFVLLTAPSTKLLVIHIFHGLYDGVSIEILFEAVWDTYHGRRKANNGFRSFQSALAHGPLRSVAGAKAFWQKQLMGDLTKTYFPSSGISVSTSMKATREFPKLAKLEQTRRQLNVTAQAIAQACWLSVLQEHTKTTTTAGVVVSGRSIDFDGADRIVGPMFNTIPYKHRSQPCEAWSVIIKRVHKFNVAVHPYQHTPLRDISKWCKVGHSQPLFDSLFVYQIVQAKQGWADNELWRVQDGEAVADYPLSLEIEQDQDDMWRITLITQSYAYDQATSNELLNMFEKALRQAVEDPSSLRNRTLDLGHATGYKKKEGHATAPSSDRTDFEWTKDASTIRRTLAELTDVSLADIKESTSMYELGLDSIDAIKLSSKLKESGINIRVSEIMRGLSISKMLPHIRKLAKTTTEQSVDNAKLELRKRELRSYMEKRGNDMSLVEDVLPLTPLQEAMVAGMVSSEFQQYYNFDVLKLKNGTNINRIQTAWAQVVEASPILRTSFAEIDDPTVGDSFVQMVKSKPHGFWSTVTIDDEPDFSSLFQELRKKAMQAYSVEPPFHILHVEGSSQAYIILSISHALYDGWSLDLLHADVKSAYEGTLDPRPSYQPSLGEILATSEDDATMFWADYLHEALPSTFKRRIGSLQSPSVVHRLERKSRMDIGSMTKFAKTNNISLQAFVQSAFAIVLASYVHSLDITFGSVLSGRDDETTSQLLFPTMNTVAIRTILHGSSLELLRHVRGGLTNIKRWQHFPLRKALALAGKHGNLFESLFIYQKSTESCGRRSQPLYTSVKGHSDVEYPVCVEMEAMYDHMIWRCATNDAIFDNAGANELLDRLDEVLTYLMRWPDKPLIDFTPYGTSLCGLPPFGVDGRRDTNTTSTMPKNERQQEDISHPETVRAIRTVLAVVSNTPENEISNDMTIFHLGLDSISAIKVSSLLRHRGIVLSVGGMLRAGSVGRMAHIADVRSSRHSKVQKDFGPIIKETLRNLDLDKLIRSANSEGCYITDITKVDILPATAGQIYMISRWLNTKGNNFYPEFTYRIMGGVSFDTLQHAWTILVAKNPILRTYFVATQDRHIPYVQIAHRKSEEQVSTVVNVSSHTDEQAFQTTKQPWAHLYVTQIKSSWQMKFKIHHALYDGVSLPLLISQLQNICNGIAASTPKMTIEKFVGSYATPSMLETRKSFWTMYLAGIEQSYVSWCESATNRRTEIFSPGLLSSRSIEQTARHNGVSVQAFFLAAYARLHAKFTKTRQDQDVVIGIYLANRSLPIADIETAAIPTVNLLPLRVCTSLQKNLTEVAQKVQQDLQRIGELAHASTSLFEINEWTSIKVDSFVNLLTLPDAGTMDGEVAGGEDVRIISQNQWERGVDAVIEHSVESQNWKQEKIGSLSNEKINKAYLVSQHSP